MKAATCCHLLSLAAQWLLSQRSVRCDQTVWLMFQNHTRSVLLTSQDSAFEEIRQGTMNTIRQACLLRSSCFTCMTRYQEEQFSRVKYAQICTYSDVLYHKVTRQCFWFIKLRMMRWVWHVARMREKINAYTALVVVSEGKRQCGTWWY
jgi:hypothetical protein